MRPALLWHLGRLFSWPHWSAHATRTILTSLGVALGVATVVGIADVSRSVLAAFQGMVDAVAGEAELEVSSPVGDLNEALIEEVLGVAGVGAAVGVIERLLPLSRGDDSSLYLIGIDFLGSNIWRQQFPREAIEVASELEFVSQVDSVVLPEEFLDRNGMRVGEQLFVVTPEGTKTLVVRGRILGTAAASLFGGNIALMDLPAAQMLLGRERRVDRIAVDVMGDSDTAEVAEALRRALTKGSEPLLAETLLIAPPEMRGRQAEQLLFSLRMTLAIMSLGAVIVGAFIVYHTIAASVQQRKREFALLNACGVGRHCIVMLCVLETIALAVPGVLVGVALGRVLAALAARIVGDTASQIWLPVSVTQAVASETGAWIGCSVGLLIAVLAAYTAMRATLGTPTVEALRPAGLASEAVGAVVGRIACGLLLIASCWAIAFVPVGVGYSSTLLAIIVSHSLVYIGMAVLAAPVVWVSGVAAARGVAWKLPLPGTLAAQNMPRQPGRSAGTVATIAATMAIAVVVVSLVQSFEAGWLAWLREHFRADLFVGRGHRVRLIAGTPMAASVGDMLTEVPGVAAVESFRTIPITVNGMPIFVQGVDVDQRLARDGLPMREGTLEDASGPLRSGAAVLLSDNLSYKMSLHKGDRIAIPTNRGLRQFAIEGTYIDYLGSLDLGAVLVGHEHLQALWDDHSVNLFRIWLSPDAAADAVKGEIQTLLAEQEPHHDGRGYYVLNAGEFLRGVQSAVQKFFAATWALEVVAALVGVIGVVNTQLSAVLDRATEIAVLRTIGLSRRDIVRSVVLECAALGALGGLLGVLLGAMLGAQTVILGLRLVTGWNLEFHVPWAQVIAGVAIATLVSALAGYVPARAAAHLGRGQRSAD